MFQLSTKLIQGNILFAPKVMKLAPKLESEMLEDRKPILYLFTPGTINDTAFSVTLIKGPRYHLFLMMLLYFCSLIIAHHFILLRFSRVSKTHGHTNACPRKIVQILRNILTFERRTCKSSPFFLIFLAQFDRVFSNFVCFYSNFSA